jgi:hypothetical protein
MICTTVEGEEVTNIPDRIRKIANSVLDEETKLKDFERKVDEFKSMQGVSFAREDRKKLTFSLRNIPKDIPNTVTQNDDQKQSLYYLAQFSPDKINKLKKSLKESEDNQIAELIEDLGSSLLSSMQQLEGIAFPKIKEGSKDLKEGQRVKNAINTLKAYDWIIKLQEIEKQQNSEAYREIIGQFGDLLQEKYSPLKAGLKALFENKNQDLFNLLENRKNLESDEKINEIVKKMLKLKPDTGIIGECIGNLFDFKASDSRAKEPDTLYKVVARHIVIAFNAFENIGSIGENYKGSIINSFINNGVLIKNNWKDVKVGEKREEVKLDVNIIKERIKRYANLSENKMLSKNNQKSLENLGQPLRKFLGKNI